MIVIKLMGGLGNQMFQYALGRSLSLKNHDILKLDISDYVVNISPHKTKREYKLSFFNIVENIASHDEVLKLKNGWFYDNKFFNKILQKIKIYSKTYYKEKQTNVFDPKFFDLKGDAYLDGYWQNENYFKDIKEILIKEFTLRNKSSEEFLGALTEIKNSNSVAMHIRGGDYVKDKKTSLFQGNLNKNYYLEAINLMKNKTQNPKFFVFTDDIEHAVQILNEIPEKFCFLKQFKLEDYEELILMSNCNHFILANSSFSWWGAYLSQNVNKIVVAPKVWFNDGKMRKTNLALDLWIKI